jgi:hypothetical protein
MLLGFSLGSSPRLLFIGYCDTAKKAFMANINSSLSATDRDQN